MKSGLRYDSYNVVNRLNWLVSSVILKVRMFPPLTPTVTDDRTGSTVSTIYRLRPKFGPSKRWTRVRKFQCGGTEVGPEHSDLGRSVNLVLERLVGW